MAVDLLVTDETIENPLVLKRLLSDIIERIPDSVNEVIDDNFITKVTNIIAGNNIAAIEVQDEGITLSKTPTKFNFKGAGVTLSEIVDDEIIITVTSGPTLLATSEYCPGYTFVFVDTDTWQIDLLDVTNLFSVGRRLKFIDSALTYYGIITSVDYNITQPNDTTINMDMEGTNVLTNTIDEVCLVTGTAAWSRIAGDPFNGTAINDIMSGLIGNDNFWIIIGDGGKLAYSTDSGIIWINVITGTSENLNQIDYNPINQSFVIGGNANTIIRSVDGVNWTLDTAQLAAITTTGTGDVLGIIHDSKVNEWAVVFIGVVTQYRTIKSIDDGITWTDIGAIVPSIGSSVGFEPDDVSSGPDSSLVTGSGQDPYRIANPSDTSFAIITSNGISVLTAWIGFYDGTTNRRVQGQLNGNISNNGTDTNLDNVTFGASSVNDFAFSNLHQRVIAIANDGKIGYNEAANLDVADSWTLINNGFDPLTNINTVHWDSNEGIFIAGASNGQICRSTNGLD